MKKWENPELNVLGLANTKEEGIETADEKWGIRCPYCRLPFLTDAQLYVHVDQKHTELEVPDGTLPSNS